MQETEERYIEMKKRSTIYPIELMILVSRIPGFKLSQWLKSSMEIPIEFMYRA